MKCGSKEYMYEYQVKCFIVVDSSQTTAFISLFLLSMFLVEKL